MVSNWAKGQNMPEIPHDIITAAAQGDAAAFETIYRGCAGLVYSTACRIVNNRESAAEVTREVFIAVYRKLPSFAFRSSFTTWLYRISVNATINQARKTAREQGGIVTYDEQTMAVPTMEATDDALEREPKRQLIARLLTALNPDQRACIVLRNIDGLSYEEIAATLEINVNTVRSRLKRAREKLIAIRSREDRHAV